MQATYSKSAVSRVLLTCDILCLGIHEHIHLAIESARENDDEGAVAVMSRLVLQPLLLLSHSPVPSSIVFLLIADLLARRGEIGGRNNE